MRPIHIAADLNLSRATITYHLRRLRFEDPDGNVLAIHHRYAPVEQA